MPHPRIPQATTTHSASRSLAQTDGNLIEANERGLILKALDDTGWNQSEAARLLGVTRDFLRYRIAKYELRNE